MGFKFKVGDRVKVIGSGFSGLSGLVGEEGVVTGLGGKSLPNKGTVVTNEKFLSGGEEYSEHGRWFPDDWLELVD